jgi:hypothetical protein
MSDEEQDDPRIALCGEDPPARSRAASEPST